MIRRSATCSSDLNDEIHFKTICKAAGHKFHYMLSHLQSSIASTGTDGTHVFLLPLVSNLVHFPIIITCWLICRTLVICYKSTVWDSVQHLTSTLLLLSCDAFLYQTCFLFVFTSRYLRGSHLNSPLPLPRQVQLIMWPFSPRRSHFSPIG